MPNQPPQIANRVLDAVGLQPISRPNVNFARTALPLHTPDLRDYDRTNYPRRLHQPTRILDSENKAGIDPPPPVPTLSINWWPYPPWGQSTLPLPSSEMATSSLSPPPVAVVSAGPSTPTTSSSAVMPSVIPSVALGATTISTAALPLATTLPSRPNVHAAAHSGFNPLYLIPVFIVVGLLLGALAGLLGYRWYSRRLSREGRNSFGTRRAAFIPGPPYVPMRDTSPNAGRIQEATLTAGGSPSKYTRHGAPRATKTWLSSGSRRASTRSTVTSLRESTTATSAPSHPHPLSARSRGSAVSPVSPSDQESSRYAPTRNKSIRRNILERLQRRSDRSTRGVSRDPSRRTAQTDVSTASAYSGTHSSDSPSVVPSHTPTIRDTNTEWVPGSGFRIVEEAISSPLPPSTADHSSVSGIPGRTSAWDDGEALRQAVDTHPGERWLAWTRNWTSTPPLPSEDIFTTVPSRRIAQERKDIEVLLRSPPQVTSSPLQSTLTFSPQPGRSTRPANKLQPQAPARTRQAQQAARDTSSASSVALGDGHGTPAMRYAARHTALSRVEEILAHSYSSRDLARDSPFGAGLASSGENVWAAGIDQRLASADREEV